MDRCGEEEEEGTVFIDQCAVAASKKLPSAAECLTHTKTERHNKRALFIAQQPAVPCSTTPLHGKAPSLLIPPPSLCPSLPGSGVIETVGSRHSSSSVRLSVRLSVHRSRPYAEQLCTSPKGSAEGRSAHTTAIFSSTWLSQLWRRGSENVYCQTCPHSIAKNPGTFHHSLCRYPVQNLPSA